VKTVQLPDFLLELKKITRSEQPLYLVGGAVRDFLLGQPCKDFDIVLSENVHRTARKYADQMNGAIYTLDESRHAYRVILGQKPLQKTIIDFVGMQGKTIDEDLMGRDFTINAMAIDIASPSVVIDPYKGGRDLQEKKLRPVSAYCFSADPLRVIRAVRYAVNLDLKMETVTSELIRDAVPGLKNISFERKRDELFKIFDGRNVYTALYLLGHFHVFEHIPLRVREDFQTTLDMSRVLEEIIGWLTGAIAVEKQAAFHEVALFLQLGKFQDKFRQHYLAKNSSDRTRKGLLFLLHTLEPDSHSRAISSLHSLHLSAGEVNSADRFYSGYPEFRCLLFAENQPTPVKIYDFFRATEISGVDLIVSCLAEYRTRMGVDFSQDEWLRLLDRAQLLLSAWWEKPEIVTPSPLLTGDEIMEHSLLKPGPGIGECLDALIHQQVAGRVKTKKEALDWLASFLEKPQKYKIKVG
jgi:tRNA nucleotidyltransferase/poly(A) polymerase